MDKIQHFSHEHPLILIDDQSNVRSRFYCDGCHEAIFGSRYRCEECDYALHKSCAELLRELQHPLHLKHPLILLPEPPSNPKQFKCMSCENTSQIKKKGPFVYHCSLCKFDLDIKCASLPLTMEVENHDHPLILMRKLTSFTCDACGKEDKGMPYLCAMCGLCFHLICASSQRTVKNILHDHSLKLTIPLQNEQLVRRFCEFCVEKEDLDNWVYHCSICDIVAHLNCATNERTWDKNFGQESNDKGSIDESISQLKYEHLELDEFVDTISYIVKKINLEGDGTEIAIEIKHFSHEHDLTLIDNLDNNQKCDGCVRHIFPPFYSCAKCSFFLHKSCAQLPKKIHRTHRHPITLLPPSIDGAFDCDGCGRDCNGFIYNCDQCDSNFDVNCCLGLNYLTKTVTLDGHEHPLHFTVTTNKVNCTACGDTESYKLRCAECEFALDSKCATLPRTVWYRQYEQPFILQFTAEDDSGEYYCDICEESRDSKHWFYYCAEGSCVAHTKCIIGKYPNIKFEKTYKFDFHLHPLTLVKEMKEKAPCNKCGDNCGELDFECTDCNFKVHRSRCLKEMMTNG